MEKQPNLPGSHRGFYMALAAVLMALIGIGGGLGVRIYLDIQDKYENRNAGIAAYKEGNYQDAVNELKISLEKEVVLTQPVDRDTRLYLADCYYMMGDYPSAIQEYDTLLSTEVELVSYLTLQKTVCQGILDFEAENYEAAYPAFETAVEQGHKECAIYAGVCATELGKTDAAMSYLTMALSDNPQEIYACVQLAEYYLEQENYETCMSYIDMARACGDNTYDEQLNCIEYGYYFAKRDYNTAYDLLKKYREAYGLSDELQKEFDFLMTRQTLEEPYILADEAED